MGVTDQVTIANQELWKNLGYKLDLANADQFRTAIAFCGIERFRLCLKLVSLMGDYGPGGAKLDGNSRHKVLLELMRLTAPRKNPATKYRNPAVQKAVEVNQDMDNRVMQLLTADE